MDVCIVGHGPSLLQVKKGAHIDSFDKVIRQKLSWALLERPEYFGTKASAACCSFPLLNQIRGWNAPEYWVFFDSRTYDIGEDHARAWADGFGAPLKYDKALCDAWDAKYRELRTPFRMASQMERKKTSDDLGHLHMSAGLHTLIYACEFLKPKTVTLAGYDNVMSGAFTWSCARGPDYNEYPDHRWDIEMRMIPMIEDHWGVEVHSL